MEIFLNSYGLSLTRNNGMFRIRDKDGKYKDLSLSRVERIYVHTGISISSDAIFLALESDIDIVFSDHAGFPKGRVWNHKYGSIASIRKNQIRFAKSASALNWIKGVIKEKLDNQMALLATLSTPGDVRFHTIEKVTSQIQRIKEKLKQTIGRSIEDVDATLRGLEGASSKLYFSAVSNCLPEQYRFGVRSQHPAKDGFNCLLNYAYGILYGKIEAALINAGLDPALGIFHRDDYNKPALVYDVIEKFRVWSDYVVVDLLLQEVIFKEFFEEKNGGVWLTQDGKIILITAFNDYLNELITLSGLSRSRMEHINIFTRNLASQLKSFEDNIS